MRDRMIAAIIIVVGLLVPACAEAKSADKSSGLEEPASLEAIEGSDIQRVILTADAVERLDLQTAPVEAGASGHATTIPQPPSSTGSRARRGPTRTPSRSPTCVSRSPSTASKARSRTCSDGPEPGTQVVTLGAPELFGVESGIGD